MAREISADPILQHRFTVEISGITQAGFNDVSGLDMQTAIVEYRNGDEIRTVRKLPGLHTYSNIVCKRGMLAADQDIYNYRHKVVEEDFERLEITFHLQNDKGDIVKSWNVTEAWPCKYVIPEMNAQGNAVAIETLEIAHEGVVEA